MNVRESFRPIPMTANATHIVGGSQIAGFLAKTSGTITVTGPGATAGATVTFVDAVPVTAGIYTPIPMNFSTSAGGLVTLLGGASGTLFT